MHRAADCPFDFPDPQNYKELTEEMLLGHKRGGLGGSKPVAMITLSSRVEDVEEMDSSLVGAIMPSAVLGAGSESEEDMSAPLTVAHLQWLCCLMGPLVDEPITVKTMLDCRAHIVLIDELLVRLLGLRQF
jgi:hypothetical protein